MIAVWMLYCLGIGLAFVVVGHALERGLHLAGRPTRWAWIVALVGSYVIPTVAWLRPEAFATFPVPAAPAVSPTSALTSTAASVFNQATSAPSSLGDFDATLRWAWALASLMLMIWIATGGRRLATLRRRWPQANIDGRAVLISPRSGPAVVGIWSPRIVLPRWAVEGPEQERELIFAHEEQHIRAADPALSALGFFLVAVAPWNLALWWQWRRLRLAIEVDCDARVLEQGCSAAAYGDLLLRVGKGHRAQLVGVAAFGEPVSFLESRIRRMLARVPRWRWAGVGAALIVAVAAIVAACEAPRPLVPRATAQEPSNRMSAPQTAWLRENIRQFFPTLGDPSGPPLDAYLIYDANLRVYQATLTRRGHDEIGTIDLRRAFAPYEAGHDGWVLVDRSSLQGIVRDNVRVISLHHDPQPQDTMPSLEDRLDALREQARGILSHRPSAVSVGPNKLSTLEADSGVRLQLEQTLEQLRWKQRDDALGTLAKQAEPAAFDGAANAIALIVDVDNRLIAHSSGTLQPGQQSCRDALVHLLPTFRNTRFPISGCLIADRQRPVVVYWGQLANR